MNCFLNGEKYFMNQEEKCSPKLASINNSFYSWLFMEGWKRDDRTPWDGSWGQG